MKLGYTIYFVPDVIKAVEFYERAFGLERNFVHESNQFAEMKTGETKLSFTSYELIRSEGIPFAPHSKADAPSAFEIALVTPDVKKAFKRAVAEGAEILIEPKMTPWGQEVAYVRDLNGFLVDICSPVT